MLQGSGCALHSLPRGAFRKRGALYFCRSLLVSLCTYRDRTDATQDPPEVELQMVLEIVCINDPKQKLGAREEEVIPTSFPAALL